MALFGAHVYTHTIVTHGSIFGAHIHLYMLAYTVYAGSIFGAHILAHTARHVHIHSNKGLNLVCTYSREHSNKGLNLVYTY